MSSIRVKTLTNVNAYFEGESWAGLLAEFSLPEIKQRTAEHKALGMWATASIPGEGLDALESSGKFAGFYPAAFARILDPTTQHRFQIRGAVQTWNGRGNGGAEGLVVTVAGFYTGGNLGTCKPGEGVLPEFKLATNYLKIVAGSVELLEIDTFANVHRVAGRDVRNTYRNLIGV